MILETISPTASWAEASPRLPQFNGSLGALSPAKCLLAGHLPEGLTNRQIGIAVGKSKAMVKNQVSAILAKCGVPPRARLIAQLR